MITVPPPSPRYDHANEAAFRRSLEQALARLQSQAGGGGTAGTGTAGTIPIWGASNTLGDSSMTEAGGVVNFGARPTVGAESLAYVSQLFTQAAADARYKPIGYVPAWSEITGTPTTVAGYGITDALSIPSGDARYLQLTGGTLTGALNGTQATFSGDVDAADFVLVGGSSGGSGGAALVDVYDEGTLITNNLASLNFVGAGVTATNVGGDVTVQIVFDQAAADARYALLGHTHPASDVTNLHSAGNSWWLQLNGSGQTLTNLILAGNVNPFVEFSDGTYVAYWQMAGGDMSLYHNGATRFAALHAGGQVNYGKLQIVKADGSTNIAVFDETLISFGMALGSSAGATFAGGIETTGGNFVVPNGQGFYARRADNATVRVFGYDSGTNDLSTVMGGGIWRVRDTGSGVPMSLTSDGILDIANRIRLAGVDLAEFTSSYNILYRRDGGIGLYLGGADPANYYDNSTHIFRNRSAATLATINSSGVTATDFILS